MEKHQIGTITDYLPEIDTALITLTETVSLGDEIIIGEGEEQFGQTIELLQIGEESVDTAEAGAQIGTEVIQPVKVGMPVFKEL